MRALIIDDWDYKIEGLRTALAEFAVISEVAVARSFQTGVKSLEELQPDLVLLDMTLPTFELPDGELDGRTRIFGGREILAEMEFLGLAARVVIVSQFESFGESPNTIELTSLLQQLKKTFPELVAGGVYYSNVDSTWREKLRVILRSICVKRS